jgi:hypothetical protein
MAVSPYPRYWAEKVGKTDDGPLYRGFYLPAEDSEVETTPHTYKTKNAALAAILAVFPRLCACGCKEETRGGEFRMGHDARHKSNLIKEALAGNDEALAEIERRGWLSFLDKAREIAARPVTPKAERKAKEDEDDEAKAQRAHDRINVMKAACTVLKAVGQYHRASGMQIRIDTIDEAARILEGAHEDLVATPGDAEWNRLTDRQIGACGRFQVTGLFFPGTDFAAWLHERLEEADG